MLSTIADIISQIRSQMISDNLYLLMTILTLRITSKVTITCRLSRACRYIMHLVYNMGIFAVHNYSKEAREHVSGIDHWRHLEYDVRSEYVHVQMKDSSTQQLGILVETSIIKNIAHHFHRMVA